MGLSLDSIGFMSLWVENASSERTERELASSERSADAGGCLLFSVGMCSL